MFVSLLCDELEPRCHLYHNCRQYLEQQMQQQQQHSSATTADWTSFYRSSSYSQRWHFQHSTPPSTSPYLDYCNAVLPAYSWRQLCDKAASTSQRNGCGNQQTTYCSCDVRSESSAMWSDGVNSMSYENNRRSVHDYHALSDVQHATDAATRWYMDKELNAQRLASASDHYQPVSTRSQSASYCQHQTHVVCETPSRDAHRSELDEFHTIQSSSQSRELVDSPSTQSADARQPRQPRRTKDALVPLIIRAILSTADTRLSLADICRYIKQNSSDYAKCDDQVRWHNNVRHTLSHYEFFVKCGRVPTGRGNYWTVHPVCRAAFAADDLRIKRARHAVQLYEKIVNVTELRHHRDTYADRLH